MYPSCPSLFVLISIHAAREGGDGSHKCRVAVCVISIHAAREGGDPRARTVVATSSISIHAAREGGDLANIGNSHALYISIHAAREGGDASCPIWLHGEKEFQSTPPVKAATIRWRRPSLYGLYFNPRRP